MRNVQVLNLQFVLTCCVVSFCCSKFVPSWRRCDVVVTYIECAEQPKTLTEYEHIFVFVQVSHVTRNPTASMRRLRSALWLTHFPLLLGGFNVRWDTMYHGLLEMLRKNVLYKLNPRMFLLLTAFGHRTCQTSPTNHRLYAWGLFRNRKTGGRQAVSRRILTAEAVVRSQGSPCAICGGGSGTGTGFSPSPSVFPCQYHSTDALYSLMNHLRDGQCSR
jgi:hypothetical protein